jgi:hypothetical protein
MSGVDVAQVAATFNLTDAEAGCVQQFVETRGMSVEAAVLKVRGDRCGAAGEPEFRPLSAEAAEQLGVDADDPHVLPAREGEVETVDDEAEPEDAELTADGLLAEGDVPGEPPVDEDPDGVVLEDPADAGNELHQEEDFS